jgi:hypothetical protein
MKARKADKSKTYLVRVSELEEDRQGIAVLGRVLTFEEVKREMAHLKGSPRTQASTAKQPPSIRRPRGTTAAQPEKQSKARREKK